MTSCTPAPFSSSLAAGQTLTRAFAAGDELFCAAGTLQLRSSALAGIDAVPGLKLTLRAGQSWRAPMTLWLQLTAVDAATRLRCTPAAAPEQAAPAADWRARASALFRSWRTLGA